MFTTCSRTKSFLESMGVEFVYRSSIKLDRLRPDWQGTNTGRALSNPRSEDAIIEYAERMDSGESAPAVILIETVDGYLPLDGFQRLCAAETLGLTVCAAYIVSGDSAAASVDAIRIISNGRINGSHAPRAIDTLRQALRTLHTGHGWSLKDIATKLGQPLTKVEDEHRVMRVTDRIEATGYSGKLRDVGKNKSLLMHVDKVSDPSDWNRSDTAPWIKKAFDTLEECSFKNGVREGLLTEFFDVKRTKGKDRGTQFKTRYSELRKDPTVRLSLNGSKALPPLLEIQKQLRSAVTVIHKCRDKKHFVDDAAMAENYRDQLRLIQSGLRDITPHDLKYKRGGNGDIYKL